MGASDQPDLPVRRAKGLHAAQCLRIRCADDARPLSLAPHAALRRGALLNSQFVPRWQENGPQLRHAGDPRRRPHHRPGGPCYRPVQWRCRWDHCWLEVVQWSRVRVAEMSSHVQRSIGRHFPMLGSLLHAWEEGGRGLASMWLTGTMGRVDPMRMRPSIPRVVRVRTTYFSLLLLDIASRCWKKVSSCRCC